MTFEDRVRELFGENIDEILMIHNCPRIFLLILDVDGLKHVQLPDGYYTLRTDDRDIKGEGLEALMEVGYDIIYSHTYADDDWIHEIFILKER